MHTYMLILLIPSRLLYIIVVTLGVYKAIPLCGFSFETLEMYL